MIDAEGHQVGVISRFEALQMAQSAELDLVEVSPTADPPVCRIMDFGKFLFEQNKKAHDYQVKLRNLIRFLQEGDKAKVTMRFRGREMAHQEVGRELLMRVQKDLSEFAQVEQNPLMEGRQMVMMFGPKKK